MRYERIPGTMGAVEIFEPTHCAGCGGELVRGSFTFGWRGCACTDGRTGHRVAHCMRTVDGRQCHGQTVDPPCFMQTGPTGDYGSDLPGISTHRPAPGT